MKKVVFQGTSKDDLCSFPAEARREAGYQLNKVQHGLDPSDWKPMRNIGPGVREVRIREDKWAKADIELARKRYKEIGKKS